MGVASDRRRLLGACLEGESRLWPKTEDKLYPLHFLSMGSASPIGQEGPLLPKAELGLHLGEEKQVICQAFTY